jgi:hypothetical protein
MKEIDAHLIDIHLFNAIVHLKNARTELKEVANLDMTLLRQLQLVILRTAETIAENGANDDM